MKKNSRIRKTNKNIPSRKWRRIIIAVVAAFITVTAGAVLWRAVSHKSANTTVMHASVPEISAVRFTDDGTVLFGANDIPTVNNNRTMSEIMPLTISYNWMSGPYQRAIKPNLSQSDIDNGVKISPLVRGTFKIQGGGDEITFTPTVDWPADTDFTVRIDKHLFNDDVSVDKKTISFTTPKITATVSSFNLYPAPDAKQSVVGVAVISFNYPIDTANFTDKILVKLDDHKLDFDVKLDKFHRTAVITTAPIKITNSSQIVRLKLNRVSPASGDGATKKLTAHTTVESADNIFKVASITTTAADDTNGNARQLVLVDMTTAAARNTDWAKNVDIYLLPEFKNDDEQADNRTHHWGADEITDDVLKLAQKLDTTRTEFVNPAGVYQYAFPYVVSDTRDRFIYVRVTAGLKSESGFTMKNTASSVMAVPYPPRTVKIAGSGALLSLGGDKNLAIMARGGATAAYVNLYKIKSSEINHLISQTYNIFSENIDFNSWSFGPDDMSVVFTKKITFSDTSMTRTNYASINLGDYLDRTNDKTGIFVIQTGPDENSADSSDRRLILLTDLGIIRKVSTSGASALFVVQLSDGAPAADTEISVLGRNGNAVWAGRTDENGRADLPTLSPNEYRGAREPVAIVARRGTDVSFIPYNAGAPMVDYSKFDVDGVYSYGNVPLNAFIFTDRGIYRAGEKMIIGGIVKNKSFKSLAGIPVRMEIRDPRGRDSFSKTFSVTHDGMFDTRYEIPATAATGEYQVHLYSLDARNNIDNTLGGTTFRVADFVPDNLKISTNITDASDNGWISPENMHANVSLRNLFGTAATDKRISVQATLRPTNFTFPGYSDYKFTTNFISGTGLSDSTARNAQTFSVDLPDVRTDENGAASFDIAFNDSIPMGTYTLSIIAQGFEGDSGRSVRATATTRVSGAKYLVGYRATGDLDYISRGATRSVHLIALDHTGTAATATGLRMRLVRRENLTSLVKDYSGYYKYQTVTRDKVINQTPIDIPNAGRTLRLDTDAPGTYFIQILDAADKTLANIEYFVAGNKNTELKSDTNAELKIKLSSTEYKPGEKIAVSITAPYAGTGLVTIERDRVYAYKWFHADTTTSVQHITVPEGFSGTGYVNVSFVRNIASRDVFTNPYAYAVAPFSVNLDEHRINVKLATPDIVRDHTLNIKYTADRDARMMIFAVNTGILQVAKYTVPQPLKYFFQKSALQVTTFQTLSLLLPEYKILREFAKTGGGDFASDADGQILNNPFARRGLAPVAFYSGILDVAANTPGEIKFDLPEYFNGAVRVFAVATDATAMGSADTNVHVQSPVVISMSAPTVVAPGDRFNISGVISNLTDGTGANAIANISVRASDNLKLGQTSGKIAVPENTENLFITDVLTGNDVGNAQITMNAVITSDGVAKSNAMATSDISVRPTTTFQTTARTGILGGTTTHVRTAPTKMFPDTASREMMISGNASVLMRPLFLYLNGYDFPCTEQLVSGAMPYVVAPNDAILGTGYSDSRTHIDDTIRALQSRQAPDGSFELWPNTASVDVAIARNTADDAMVAETTAYVAQFLTMARAAGFNVPSDMHGRAIDFLRDYAGGTITDDQNARAVAHAIFVITQNNFVTTNYINLFQEYADKNIKNWQRDLMGTYIAAAYKIMHQDAQADALIAKYRTSDKKFEYIGVFANNVANDAIHNYIVRRYFDKTPDITTSMQKYIDGGNYDSFTAAMTIMGLHGTTSDGIISGISVVADGEKLHGKIVDNYFSVQIPNDASRIEIKCPGCKDNAAPYYSLISRGYPTSTTDASNGISVLREYFDSTGERITSGNIGDIVTVRIFARARGTDFVPNVAITDLLPGGFVVDGDVTGNATFTQVRDDRVVVFADVSRSGETFEYRAQLTTSGEFNVPPIHAESMYNPGVNATGDAEKFTVKNEAH